MADRQVPDRARVVVVGGGIVGCSIAYHLVRRGWADVLLLERHTLTSGTTWHAAGLITQARPTAGMRRIVRDSLEVFSELEAETGIGFQTTGTIHLASTRDRWEELLRQAATMKPDGIDAHPLDPDAIVEHFPLLDPAGLVGGVHYPKDGRGNATDTTLALARAAKDGGATVIEGVTVTDVVVRNGQAQGVRTPAGDVESEFVINATGMWGRQFAASHGVSLPLQALEHYYLVTDDVPGIGNGWPTLKSPDDCAYVKDDAGKLMVGFFEPGSVPWEPHRIPEDVEFATLSGEWEHLMPHFERIAKRIPGIADLGVRLFFCGPESFTPDGVYHLGEVDELRNYFVAAGFNSIGFLSGPGAGRYIADWLIDGHPPYALTEADPRRTQPYQRNRRYLQERVTETLDVSYGIHWPFEQRETARGIRRSPLHDRVEAAGAVFGEASGWERANWYAGIGQGRRYEYSFGPQNWFESSAREHQAVRQEVGIFDTSSFGKLLVQGPAAAHLMQRVCSNDVDRAVGCVTYTQMLNERGGIEADITVTRTSADQFLVLTAAASTRRDADWLRRHARPNEFVIVNDVSNSMAMLSLMGPRSRDLLARLTDANLDDGAFPFGTSAEIDLGLGLARATRLTYVGELGWELLIPTDMAAHTYDAIVESGADLGLHHAGYHALNSLRIEKAYRSWGHDIGPDDSPLEAGLGFAVSWDKLGGFIGRDALMAQRESGTDRSLVQLLLRAPAAMAYHDEPVLRDGEIVGAVTSAAYGHTLGGTVCLAYVSHETAGPVDALTEGRYQVGVADRLVAADISVRPLYDPTSARIRS